MVCFSASWSHQLLLRASWWLCQVWPASHPQYTWGGLKAAGMPRLEGRLGVHPHLIIPQASLASSPCLLREEDSLGSQHLLLCLEHVICEHYLIFKCSFQPPSSPLVLSAPLIQAEDHTFPPCSLCTATPVISVHSCICWACAPLLVYFDFKSFPPPLWFLIVKTLKRAIFCAFNILKLSKRG